MKLYLQFDWNILNKNRAYNVDHEEELHLNVQLVFE